MRINTLFRIVLFAIIPGLCGTAGAADADTPNLLATTQMPANVVLIETVMRRDALHQLNSTSGVRLPRIRVFGVHDELLLYVVGWQKDVPARLQRVLQQPHPLPNRESLTDLIAQVTDGAAHPMQRERLPSSEVVIVTAWAGWCLPCAAAIRGLRDAMAADPNRHYLWITVETDALKQKLLLPGVRSGG